MPQLPARYALSAADCRTLIVRRAGRANQLEFALRLCGIAIRMLMR